MTLLSNVAASVHARLDDYRQGEGRSTVAYEVGAKHLATHVAPPIVVWVRSKANHIGGGKRHGPRTTDEVDADGDPLLQRQLWARQQFVTLHIWATDDDEAEQLILDLMLAAHETLSSSYDFHGETWPKQADHEHLKRGAPVRVQMSVDTPVPGRLQPTVTVTALEPDDNQIVDEIS